MLQCMYAPIEPPSHRLQCCPCCRPLPPAGLAPRYPLYQRVALMQLVRSLLSDPVLTYHLFAAYDLAADRKLDAVQVGGAGGVIAAL